MNDRARVHALALQVALALSAGSAELVPALAAGGDGDMSSRTSTKPADPDYTAAVQAIKQREFSTAIRLLQGVVARDPASADAYNWLGYAIRRNGDPAAAIPMYERALAIDPRHRGVNEYLGEAYLMLGDLPRARERLKRLDSLCFFSCEEYRDLKKAVEAYERSGGKIRPTASE
jgi:tetratricopeptide (TPR) repeat protein